ncbi:MAG TPA: hypothetical protein VIW07_13330 [Candidatus Udaeobacter sp.]|jgi:hypothetical protein
MTFRIERIITICRVLNTLLLLSILIVLALILYRIPHFPSQADVIEADKPHSWKTRAKFFERMPAVAVVGSVAIDGPVNIEDVVPIDGTVSISEPLDVKVTGCDVKLDVKLTDSDLPFTRPIPVEIQR